MFSNELRSIGWRGHIYSECGRMIGYGLYHIQTREDILCGMPMKSWGILE
jgi:muconolactone delta-isomerase